MRRVKPLEQRINERRARRAERFSKRAERLEAWTRSLDGISIGEALPILCAGAPTPFQRADWPKVLHLASSATEFAIDKRNWPVYVGAVATIFTAGTITCDEDRLYFHADGRDIGWTPERFVAHGSTGAGEREAWQHQTGILPASFAEGSPECKLASRFMKGLLDPSSPFHLRLDEISVHAPRSDRT